MIFSFGWTIPLSCLCNVGINPGFPFMLIRSSNSSFKSKKTSSNFFFSLVVSCMGNHETAAPSKKVCCPSAYLSKHYYLKKVHFKGMAILWSSGRRLALLHAVAAALWWLATELLSLPAVCCSLSLAWNSPVLTGNSLTHYFMSSKLVPFSF